MRRHGNVGALIVVGPEICSERDLACRLLRVTFIDQFAKSGESQRVRTASSARDP